MALNLITPQYRPDITGAAKAGEDITSSMARTSLAQRHQAMREEELDLKAEAQQVSLAGQQQAMRHKERLLPLQERALNESLVSKQLDNALAASTMEDRVLAMKLGNEAKLDAIAGSALDREATRNSLIADQARRDREGEYRLEFENTVQRINDLEDDGDWDALARFNYPPLPPDMVNALHSMVEQKMGNQEAAAYRVASGRQTRIALARQQRVANAISGLPFDAGQMFEDGGGLPEEWWSGDRLSGMGQAALDRLTKYNEIIKSGKLAGYEVESLMFSSATLGDPSLRWVAGESGVKAGRVIGDSDVFVPTSDMLGAMERRIKSKEASLKALEQATQAQQDAAKQVPVIFDKFWEAEQGKDTPASPEAVWRRAMTSAQINFGQLADHELVFVLDANDFAAKQRAGEIKPGSVVYDFSAPANRSPLRYINPSTSPDEGDDSDKPEIPDADNIPDDFEVLPGKWMPKDVDGPGVKENRLAIYRELRQQGGASHEDARWMVYYGVKNVFADTSFYESDYGANDPVYELAYQVADHGKAIIKAAMLELRTKGYNLNLSAIEQIAAAKKPGDFPELTRRSWTPKSRREVQELAKEVMKWAPHIDRYREIGDVLKYDQ